MAFIGLLAAAPALAQDATWSGAATPDSNYSTGGNWAGGTPANGTAFTATFAASAQNIVTLDSPFGIGAFGIQGNQAYTFNMTAAGTVSLTSGMAIQFGSSATFNVSSSGPFQFLGGSAQTAAINVLAGGTVEFQNGASAGNAVIDNANILSFYGGSTANAATITTSAGGVTAFNNSSTGGTAAFVFTGNGMLDISGLSSSGMTAGSIESTSATSQIILGANNLTVGATGASTTFAGVISGAGGSLTKTGTGSLTLTGVNTYSGATTISGGVLIVNSSAALGDGSLTNTLVFDGGILRTAAAINSPADRAVTVNATGGTIDTNGFDSTILGILSGSGSFTKTGAGVLTLDGDTSTFTGSTTITAGTLALTGSGAFLASSNVIANGTLDVSGSSGAAVSSLTGSGVVTLGGNNLTIFAAAGEFSGHIDGAGGVGILSGTQTLSGVNTYTNVTTIGSGATLALKSAGSISASLYLAVLASGTFDISQMTSGASVRGLVASSSSAKVSLGSKMLTITNGGAFGGVIQDGGIAGGTGGGVTVASGAWQQFGAVSTYTGSTIIDVGGKLDLFNNGAIASSRELVNNGAFDISTLGGDGVVGAASIKSLSGSGNIFLGGNRLTITAANGDFSGVISDLGGASVNTGGSLILTGGKQILSGVNTYTGATTVNGGTLSVNGSIATSSLTTVNTGGTLGGNGFVGNTLINGGTLAPGNSIGTLTVQGNLTLTAGSTYAVEVSSSAADRVNVTGVATPGGATVSATYAAGSYVTKQYTILNAAGGISGSFNSLVNTNLPANFTPSLSYDGKNAFLNLTLNFTPTPTPTPTPSPTPGPTPSPPTPSPNLGSGLNVNQQNVANALVNFFNTNGGIPLVFGALTPTGLTIASGEIATAPQQAAIDSMTLFMGAMTDPALSGRGDLASSSNAPIASSDALSYAPRGARAPAAAALQARIAPDPLARRWSVWATASGAHHKTDGDAVLGSHAATNRTYGLAAGADYRLSPDVIGGFALGGGRVNFSLSGGLGSGNSELFQIGAYVRHGFGPAYVTAAAAYGWQDVTTSRLVTLSGADQLRASFDAHSFAGRLEGGYRLSTPWFAVTPYAAGQFVSYRGPAYAEQAGSGAGTFALNYASRQMTSPRAELGARVDQEWALADATLALRARAAWAHNFEVGRWINASFQTLPGVAFRVNGAAQSHDVALASAAFDLRWRNGFSVGATFETELSSASRSYAGKGFVRYAW
ncbi:autotransporter domain-containing protein [Terrarubrum flagellatum]|uniref:autotransporter domain-containing protein n=1 Tax=Terrirubrum flagellatum TaxID=2895980 RepID=UPI00314535CD